MSFRGFWWIACLLNPPIERAFQKYSFRLNRRFAVVGSRKDYAKRRSRTKSYHRVR